MAKKKDKQPLDAVSVLSMLRDDIKEMQWSAVAEDGRTLLVAKSDVLDLVQDWIEHCLNPEQTTLATAE